eukprot:scpid94830/ scgid19757/ 
MYMYLWWDLTINATATCPEIECLMYIQVIHVRVHSLFAMPLIAMGILLLKYKLADNCQLQMHIHEFDTDSDNMIGMIRNLSDGILIPLTDIRGKSSNRSHDSVCLGQLM